MTVATEIARLRRAAALADAFDHPHIGDVARYKIRKLLAASGTEAPSGGETTEIGSTVGESPTGEAGDAQDKPTSPFKSEGNSI